MPYHDSDSEYRHQDELPVPIAFPINSDLTRDDPENCTPPSGLQGIDSASDKTEEP